VSVSAPPTEPNPVADLPPPNSYAGADQVAAYRSPPYRDYAHLILKVSHNLGAQLALCLMAVHIGSDNCQAGFGVERQFLKRAGVNLKQVALNDGRGGSPDNRITPRAMVQLLSWWISQPDFTAFLDSLPVLGVDGSLAYIARDSSARGKVFAKTGTAGGGDSLNNRLVVAGKALAGYLEARHGQLRPFAVVVNGGSLAPDPANILGAAADLGQIAAAMQQAASAPSP
jgi:D-alanyl-D-alanine carboxypeptidase/D-alanyl-D-alanine-endopeptidase (penicillin-binding protein 4)